MPKGHHSSCKQKGVYVFRSVHQEWDHIRCMSHPCLKTRMPKTWLSSYPRQPGETFTFRIDFPDDPS